MARAMASEILAPPRTVASAETPQRRAIVDALARRLEDQEAAYEAARWRSPHVDVRSQHDVGRSLSALSAGLHDGLLDDIVMPLLMRSNLCPGKGLDGSAQPPAAPPGPMAAAAAAARLALALSVGSAHGPAHFVAQLVRTQPVVDQLVAFTSADMPACPLRVYVERALRCCCCY